VPPAPAVVLFIATATMNFGMACEMSGKSIACAIADDDAAVRPRSFRPDGAASPGMLIAERNAAAEEGRDLVAQRRRDRVNTLRARSASRAASLLKAGKLAAGRSAATRRLPTLPCPVRPESLPKLPIRPPVI
jgi:dihydroxyacetone kinase